MATVTLKSGKTLTFKTLLDAMEFVEDCEREAFVRVMKIEVKDEN